MVSRRFSLIFSKPWFPVKFSLNPSFVDLPNLNCHGKTPWFPQFFGAGPRWNSDPVWVWCWRWRSMRLYGWEIVSKIQGWVKIGDTGDHRSCWSLICERAGSCAEETKSIRRWPEKRKSIRSAVCHGEVDERVDWHEVEFIIDTYRHHRNVTSITSKFVCWKCNEAWCAMRRMIVLTVQTGIWLSVNFLLTSVH